MSLTAFPLCHTHKEAKATHICCQQTAKYVCQFCLNKPQWYSTHKANLIDFPTFIKTINQKSVLLETLEQKTSVRHDQLIKISSQCKLEYVKTGKEVMQNMLMLLQSENKEYKEIISNLSNLKVKLQATYDLIKYFEPFRDPTFIQMKLNLSTEKGLKKFMKKVKDYFNLRNVGACQEMQKIEKSYLLQERKLIELESRSLMVRLRDMMRQEGRLNEQPLQFIKDRVGSRQKIV